MASKQKKRGPGRPPKRPADKLIRTTTRLKHRTLSLIAKDIAKRGGEGSIAERIREIVETHYQNAA